MSAPADVRRLRGVSNAIARRLRSHGVYTSSDLLRASLAKLSSGMAPLASVADVRGWRSVASLLEVDGMRLDWAEALSRRGVPLARDLASRSFSSLRAIFSAASTAHEIATPPNDDELGTLLVDSARLGATAVINLTVTANGKKIAGARAAWGHVGEATDARGRARLLRLPASQPLVLTIEKRGYKTATLTAVASPAHVVSIERATLVKGANAKRRATHASLSEFNGDVLPAIAGKPIRQHTEKQQALRRGDVVRWVETLRGGDIKLSSVFLEYRDDALRVRLWRVPRARVPAPANPGDHFLVTRTELKPLTLSARQLARFRILRRLLKGQKKPRTQAAFLQRMRSIVKEYLKRTTFTRNF